MIGCNIIEQVTWETEQVHRLKQGHVPFYSEQPHFSAEEHAVLKYLFLCAAKLHASVPK